MPFPFPATPNLSHLVLSPPPAELTLWLSLHLAGLLLTIISVAAQEVDN